MFKGLASKKSEENENGKINLTTATDRIETICIKKLFIYDNIGRCFEHWSSNQKNKKEIGALILRVAYLYHWIGEVPKEVLLLTSLNNLTGLTRKLP